jgi:hypothetical protein
VVVDERGLLGLRERLAPPIQNLAHGRDLALEPVAFALVQRTPQVGLRGQVDLVESGAGVLGPRELCGEDRLAERGDGIGVWLDAHAHQHRARVLPLALEQGIELDAEFGGLQIGVVARRRDQRGGGLMLLGLLLAGKDDVLGNDDGDEAQDGEDPRDQGRSAGPRRRGRGRWGKVAHALH